MIIGLILMAALMIGLMLLIRQFVYWRMKRDWNRRVKLEVDIAAAEWEARRLYQPPSQN